MNIVSTIKFFLPVFFISITASQNAHAYLDPGTGSILLQGLIAAVATGLATGRFWWHKVKSIFVKMPDSSDNEPKNPDASNRQSKD